MNSAFRSLDTYAICVHHRVPSCPVAVLIYISIDIYVRHKTKRTNENTSIREQKMIKVQQSDLWRLLPIDVVRAMQNTLFTEQYFSPSFHLLYIRFIV